MGLTFGDCFAGIGGLSLGLTRAGLACRWQIEKDDWCRRVLVRHWPDVRRHDDVRTFPPADPEEWHVDLIAGGDPCQGNSRAGAVWRRPVADLGTQFLRVLDVLRPRLVLRENPPARGDAAWPWHRFRAGLESLGYAVLPFRLRSCCLGADHRRERVFLLAELADAHGERLEGFDRAGVAAEDPGRAAGRHGGEAGRDMLPSPRVCRRFDGFPPGLVRRRLTAMGNAVDPVVGEFIGRRILAALGHPEP